MAYEESTERIKDVIDMESTLNGYLIPDCARRVVRARLSNQLGGKRPNFDVPAVDRTSF